MKPAPTLADAFLRESFKPHYKKIDPERVLPKMVSEARRFVLDDTMSAFMADLAWASLLTCKTEAKALVLLDGMRSLARLPHRLTWIEYNGKIKAQRAHSEYGSPIDPNVTPERLGWLCWQHEGIETAFGAIEFVSHTYDTSVTIMEPTPQANVFAYAWRSDEGPLPWPMLDAKVSPGAHNTESVETITNVSAHPEALLVGVSSYRSASVAMINSPAGDTAFKLYSKYSSVDMRAEIAGDLRYLWALLATIGDLPTSVSDVTAAKGYFARGKYRHFLDHKVIKLHVPEKRYKRIATQAIAISRRRAHQVRGHWRKDYYHPGERLWIREHQRGDASLGFVTHDYQVTHEREIHR